MAIVTETLFDYYLSRLAASSFYGDRTNRSADLELVSPKIAEMARELIARRAEHLGSGDTDLDLVDNPGETLLDYYLANLAASALLTDRVQRRDSFEQVSREMLEEAVRLVAQRAAELGSGAAGDTINRLAVMAGAISNADLATDAPRRHNRIAAFSGKGSSSTDGAFGTYVWAPVAGNSWYVEMVVAASVAPASLCGLWVRQAANNAGVRVTTAGLIEIVNNTTVLGTTTSAAIAFNGRAHTIRVTFSGTSAVVRINGTTSETITFAAQTWQNVAANFYFGATTTASVQRWPGSIYNIEIRDLTTPANSATLLLDEPMSSSTYANSYSGTTAAATAAKQTGAAAPWIASVVSTDGRGMPWQAGCGGALVYSMQRDGTHQTIDGSTGATHTLTFNTETEDPSGSLSLTTGWTAPCAGVAAFYMHGTFANSISDDVLVYIGRAGQNLATVGLSLPVTTRANFALSASETVAAGQVWYPFVDAVAVGNTALQFLLSSFTVEFTPTPTTG